MDIEKDYYAALGLSSFATAEEIKRAYRRLARRYHPDSREVDTPTRLFHEIQEAYAVLIDPPSRRSYDRQRYELDRGESEALGWSVLLSRKALYSTYEEQLLYVLLEVAPGTASGNERLPLELALVVDRSTSMAGARLENVKEAARQIFDQLQDTDTLVLVSFNDRAEVVLSDQMGSGRAQAKASIAALRAEGGTEILQGLRLGLGELGANGRDGVLRHLVLLTDGRTYGDDEACVAAAEKAGERDIGITAMGIGEDWNDDLLDEIASRSGGSSVYIASPSQIRSLLRKEVRGLGSVFATGLNLNVRTADGVRVERAFRTSPSLTSLTMSRGVARLGTLLVDAPLKLLFEIAVERRSPGEHRLLQFELNGDIPALDRSGETLKQDIWCHFTDDEPNGLDDDVPPPILSALRKITLYRMQEQAWRALAEGHVEQATRQLEMVATRLLDLGEERLAQAALLEAEHITKRGNPTAEGRKRIKYGTRSLDTGRKAYD